MTAFRLAEVPGNKGWVKKGDRYGGTHWETYDPACVEEMRAAIEADRIACGGGKPCSDMPGHSTGWVREERTVRHGLDRPPVTVPAAAYSSHCRSGSRWFNPETRQMEGHAHCTCDGCY